MRVYFLFLALAKISMKRKITLIDVEMFARRWNDSTTPSNSYIEYFDEIINFSAKLKHIVATIKNNLKLTLEMKFLMFSDFLIVAFLMNEICALICLS